jgi:hypothetical protein
MQNYELPQTGKCSFGRHSCIQKFQLLLIDIWVHGKGAGSSLVVALKLFHILFLIMPLRMLLNIE